ncbi:hypothetical protein ABFP30_002923 [Enterobacter bugandensis]
MRQFSAKRSYLLLHDDGTIHYPFSKYLTDEFDNPNTQELVSQSLRILQRFFVAHRIELAIRMLEKRCLTYDEIKRLSGLCYRPLGEIERLSNAGLVLITSAKAGSPPENSLGALEANTAAKRLNHIASYLKFYREVFLDPHIQSDTLRSELIAAYDQTQERLKREVSGTKQNHYLTIQSLPSHRFLQIIHAIVLEPEKFFLTKGGKPSATLLRDRAMFLLACEGLRPGALGNLTREDFRPISGHLILKDNAKQRTGRMTTGMPVLKGAGSRKVPYASETMITLWPFIGHFAFLHLAFHAYCRPSSYQSLTLADLQIIVDPETQIKTYVLLVIPKKTGISARALKKIPYQLDSIVGELLEAQRIHVIKTWGQNVANDNIGKLALFPARGIRPDGHWVANHARAHFGETNYTNFRRGYLDPIRKLQESINFDFNGLRHTVGTQLAVAGCSATTIAAVLKHASQATCQKYVDVAFQGLIDALSEAMEPAFATHFPKFRSKHDPLPPEKAINSTELATGHHELTGECGKTIACQYAPLACYSCIRFTPCFDADHSINLRLVESEIIKYESGNLPFRELARQFKEARRYIMLVVAAANQYQNILAIQKTSP